MIIGAPSLVRVPGEHLVGRQRERAVLDRLLEAARGGDGGVLVVHGEPGVGKTALLKYPIEARGEPVTGRPQTQARARPSNRQAP